MPQLKQQINARLAELATFEDRAAWRRSERQNLVRQWEGLTVTVFNHRGQYGWCIADNERDERMYSHDIYETESDAMSALADELGVGRL